MVRLWRTTTWHTLIASEKQLYTPGRAFHMPAAVCRSQSGYYTPGRAFHEAGVK
ncbi:MAG: hypothetical protein PHO37_12710 [Kiritimatiellae bacterium]|nr:hypothetical protein [Kiritimatiellia bacterium]